MYYKNQFIDLKQLRFSSLVKMFVLIYSTSLMIKNIFRIQIYLEINIMLKQQNTKFKLLSFIQQLFTICTLNFTTK